MIEFRSHIARLLFVVFALTLIPYNVLHHHAEDEHAAAMQNQQLNVSHHCELDDYFCEAETTHTSCEHQHHLAKTLAKCFSCEFSFIKQFTSILSSWNLTFSATQKWAPIPYRQKLLDALILVTNKGPPVD